MNFHTVITKLANQQVPAELIQKILDKKPNVFGCAIQSSEGIATHMQDISLHKAEEVLEDLNNFNINSLGDQAILCFGQHDKVMEQCIQPFLINDPNEDTFLAFFLDGDFAKHVEPNKGTDEYNYATSILIPKITEWCHDFDGDLDKVISKINGEVFNNEFLANIGQRGTFTLLPLTGSIIQLGKNELGQTFDWGSTTQLHGFGDAKQEPEPVAAPAAKGWGKKIVAAVTGQRPIAEVTPIQQPKKEVAASVPPAGKGPVVTEGMKAVRPPGFLHSNEDKRAFYHLVGAEFPGNKGAKNGVPVLVKEETVIPETREQFDAMRAEAKKNTLGAVKTDTSAGTAPTSGKQIKEQRTSASNSPAMSAKVIDSSTDFVVKVLDGQSGEIDDPRKMAAEELKHKKWSVAHGIKIDDIQRWSVATIHQYVAQEPEAAACLLIELRAMARTEEYLKSVVVTDGKVQTTEKSKSVDGNTTTATETVVTAQAPVAKKGGWGAKKVAA